jgi:protein SCO1
VSHLFEKPEWKRATIKAAAVLVCLVFLAACGPSRSRTEAGAKVATRAEDTDVKHYPLTGRVVSIDKASQSISVDGDAIPGFMGAMTMSYQVKDAGALAKLSVRDRIKAEIVLGNDGAYLQNIVTAETTPPKPLK